MYTATKFSTAEDKAKFERQFKTFVLADFPASKFPKWFYTRLSMTFGHIAHYNQGGFYDTWFTNTQGKLDFLYRTAEYPNAGDPAWTFSDVERALSAWVRDIRLIGVYTDKLNSETEKAERAQLAQLQGKYQTT